jgi:hypothetical protein
MAKKTTTSIEDLMNVGYKLFDDIDAPMTDAQFKRAKELVDKKSQLARWLISGANCRTKTRNSAYEQGDNVFLSHIGPNEPPLVERTKNNKRAK